MALALGVATFDSSALESDGFFGVWLLRGIISLRRRGNEDREHCKQLAWAALLNAMKK
jgi:hypothetical protein